MPPNFSPVNLADANFLSQLDAIEPGVWATPCSITTVLGETFHHCLAYENKRYSDKGKWINPAQVLELRESPFRMPAKFVRLIHDAGETGMGGHIYVVELADGNSFVHAAGNYAIDLLNLPDGYSHRDVVNVLPHEGRKRSISEGYRWLKEMQHLEYARLS